MDSPPVSVSSQTLLRKGKRIYVYCNPFEHDSLCLTVFPDVVSYD